MENFRGIETFVKTVQGGTIANAARTLGITAAAASQNIARLERELGVRLLNRTTRSLSLTEAGGVYYERVRHLMDALDDAQAALTELRGEPCGKLRISCSAAFGRTVLSPLIPQFNQQYPEVRLELTLQDQPVDFITDNIDLGICFGPMRDTTVTAYKIARMPLLYCASPGYLAKCGIPGHPDELRNHKCMLFRNPPSGRFLRWGFGVNGKKRYEPELNVTTTCNDSEALAQMAVADQGIIRLGSFIARPLIDSGKLVQLFADCSNEYLDYYTYYLERQYMPPKTRVFIDFLRAEMKARADDGEERGRTVSDEEYVTEEALDNVE